MSVIEFKPKAAPAEPVDGHGSGQACCTACNHEWVATAPLGTLWLECPSCKTERGIFKFTFLRAGVEHWTCNCGNQLFYITRDGAYCPACGDAQAW